MRGTSTRTAQTLLGGFKAVVLGALLALVVGLGLVPDDTVPPVPPSVSGDLVHLMAEHRCSATGFGDGTEPRAALVRTTTGRVRLVSFERGWAVYSGERPGTLVAVCLGAGPRRIASGG